VTTDPMKFWADPKAILATLDLTTKQGMTEALLIAVATAKDKEGRLMAIHLSPLVGEHVAELLLGALKTKPVSGHTFEDREDGLAHCLVCGGAEGSLPTKCPGKKMDATTIEAVYRERLDFNTGPMTRDPVWWLRVDHPENIVG